jgi:hypothetical protein
MKGKILCAVGAVVVLLGIVAGVIFGSDAPTRVTLTDMGGGQVRFEGQASFEFNPFTGGVEMVPLYRQKNIDVVIHGDINLYGTIYHEGDRLTAADEKLVHQNWLQARRNDLRYWAYHARKKITGKG